MGFLDGFVLDDNSRRATLDRLAHTFGQIGAKRDETAAKAEQAAKNEALFGQVTAMGQDAGMGEDQAFTAAAMARDSDQLPAYAQSLVKMQMDKNAPITPYQAATLEDVDLGRGAKEAEARAQAEYQARRDQVGDSMAQQELGIKRQTLAEQRASRKQDAAIKQDEAGKKGVEFTSKLRDKFHAQAGKSIQNITEGLNGLRASAEEDTAAGDLALLFSYGKVLDPGSVVREGELETLSNLGGVGDRLYRMGLNLKTGQRLTSEMRAEIMQAAELTAKQKVETFQPVVDQYTSIAETAGVSPADIIPDYERFYSGGGKSDAPKVDFDQVKPADISGMSDADLQAIIDG